MVRNADIVLIVVVGVRPATELTGPAGTTLGQAGAIPVDPSRRTNLPDIFAASPATPSTSGLRTR